MVRVDANVQELATDMTLIVMTALNTEGNPLTPAFVIAMTNGESLVLELAAPIKRGSSDATIRPRRNRLTT